MGRGRQKAKQTRVARELKYRSMETDFASLEEELRRQDQGTIPDAYADLAEKYAAGDYDFDADDDTTEGPEGDEDEFDPYGLVRRKSWT